MINSSFLDITTPVKEYVFSGDVTPQKLDLEKRFCPSADIALKMSQMLRVHTFLRHEEIEFFDLRSFNMTGNTADKLSRALQDFDVPDVIKRMEEIAVKRKYFTPFLSKYVSEEYCIQEEYSFTVIALLHYIKKKSVNVEEAVTELLELSSSQSICKVCCTTGLNATEKENIAKLHNFEVLKTLRKHDSDSDKDVSLSDDSKDDSLYIDSKEIDQTSEGSNETMSDFDLQSHIKEFNPFDSSDEDEQHLEEKRSEMNSTISFNPFDDEDSDSDHDETKSTPKSMIECKHCQKKFSNRNNMKQHLVRWVTLLAGYGFTCVHNMSLDWLLVFKCEKVKK